MKKFSVGIIVLPFALYAQSSSAASVIVSDSGNISTLNSDPGYTIDTSVPDYAPTSGEVLEVGTENEIHYNSILISNGININVTAADGASITLIANGDIDIAGNLNWLSGSLSLITIAGAINVSGSIMTDSLTLSAGTITLANSSEISVAGGTTRINSSDIPLITDGEIVLSAVPVPAAVWLFSSGLLGLIGVSARKNFTTNQEAAPSGYFFNARS